jgi:membrane associated rhomboid family serine protease
LFGHVGVTTVIATREKARSSLAAEIAVNALLIDIKFTSNICGPLFSFVCHRFAKKSPFSEGMSRALDEERTSFVAITPMLVFAPHPRKFLQMGSYRDYMRQDYPKERTSVLIWLICALIAGYVLQHVVLTILGDYPSFYRGFSSASYLSPQAIASGWVWTLVSYSFCHDVKNLLHIIFSVLGLYLIGRELEPAMGSSRFLKFYGMCILGGGIAWLAAHWVQGGSLVGASAGIMGLFTLFICLNPERPITFLFLFFPITFPKAKYLGYALLSLELFGFIFYELYASGSAVANSAHLGGMLVAFCYYRIVYVGVSWPRLPLGRSASAQVIPPAWAENTSSKQSPAYKVNLTSRASLRAEVDRILDKINSQGFGSLSPEEKRTLDDAKDLLNKN